jgi:hypothetical protein
MNKPAGMPSAAPPMERVAAIVGVRYVLREAADWAARRVEPRDFYRG